MNEQTTLTPIEAISEFYRLKDKYENEYYEKYIKPIIKTKKSKREKRVEFSRLPKNECINCKRNVNTIFSVTSDVKKLLKKFRAKCGDIENPCPLDIQIDYSLRLKMDREIINGLNNIEEVKLDIIKEKNNAIFFNKKVVDIFNDLTEHLKLETENTGVIIETNIIRNDNPEKKLLLKQTIDEFGKGFILPFKQMIKEFNETNNELILNNAVKFYINEMVPKLKEINSLKYNVNMVEFDEINNIYNLIQLPNSTESNEYFYNDDKVVKFVRGLKKEKKQTRKAESILKPKNKTKKVKPKVELVLEEDENEPEKDVEKEKVPLVLE